MLKGIRSTDALCPNGAALVANIADMRWTPGPHTRLLLSRLGLVLLLLMVLRCVFFLANKALFPSLGAGEAGMVLLQGYRFDAMTIVLVNALFILLHLLPFAWRERPGFHIETA